MPLHRLLLITLFLLGTTLPVQAQFVPPGIEPVATEKLADGLYTFRYGAYRSLFLVTGEGVIVTDPLSPEAALVYRAEIAKITDEPVKYVVYSHAHWDHARGGQLFKDEGARFIAQRRCKESMRASPHPDVVMPDKWFKDEYTVKLGDYALDLYYFGPSHGTCLIAMVVQPHNMIYTVDLVTPRPAGGNYMPWDPQVADFQFYNAVENLRQVEALVGREGIEIVIGAHLVPLPVGKGKFTGAPSYGPAIQITQRRQFWEDLMAAVKAEMDSGTESFMVSNRIDKQRWQKYPGYNKRKFKQLVDRIAAYYAIGK